MYTETFVVEVLTVLLHIREVPGSNLGPRTGYSDGGFRSLPQTLQADVGIVP
jgi:hypothetical protein